MFQELYEKQTCYRLDKNTYRELGKFNNQLSYIDFASNDYLGLSQNQTILKKALSTAKKYGIGATGSRLLSGNSKIFENFEKEIAKCKKTESALIFNSGFQCNISVLASLLDRKTLKAEPLVFFDKLNHSSLYQAVFLSNANMIRYRHNDMKHLANLLEKYCKDKRPKFIVTETIFGMDGDTIDISHLTDLCKKYKTFLYLDEAHATGMVGKYGYGLSTEADLTNIPHVIMGTFSKALGVSGAYLACSNIIKKYLINFCPGFIYSTANSPLTVGAAFESWKLIPTLDNLRTKVRLNSKYVKKHLNDLGLNTSNSSSNIIPIIIREEEAAASLQKKLQKLNINVSLVRPPTVPNGTSRLRVAINALHSDLDIQKLLSSFAKLWKK